MFFSLWRCDPMRVMVSSFLRFLDHTQRRTTVGRTPLDEWSARRRDLYLTTHNTHNRQNIYAPGGIQTHDLSRRAAADLRLSPRGHWDQLTVMCVCACVYVCIIIIIIINIIYVPFWLFCFTVSFCVPFASKCVLCYCHRCQTDNS